MNTRRYILLLGQAVAAGLLPMVVGMLLSEVVDLDEFGRFYAGLGLAMTAVYLGGLGLDKTTHRTKGCVIIKATSVEHKRSLWLQPRPRWRCLQAPR